MPERRFAFRGDKEGGCRRPAALLILATKEKDVPEGQFACPGDKDGGPLCLSWGQRRRTFWRASLHILGTKKKGFLEGQLHILGTKKEIFLEGQFAYPGDKEGGPVPCRSAVSLSAGTKKKAAGEQLAYPRSKEGGPAGEPVCLSCGQRRRTCLRASLLILETKKDDFVEGQFAYPGTKKEGFLEGQFAYPGDKGEGRPGGPVCLSRRQRRKASWRATLLILGTKKEDFLEGQIAYLETKKEEFLEGQFAYPRDKKVPEGQFAYPGDKEGRLPGGPVCLSWQQRRRTSRRASLLLLGTKKEDFVEGQFAYPGNKEGGLPGGPVCLSWGQRRIPSWRASLLILGTKSSKNFLEGQCLFWQQRRRTCPLPERRFAFRGDKEGGFPGGPVCLSWEQRRRPSWRANLLILGTKKQRVMPSNEDYMDALLQLLHDDRLPVALPSPGGLLVINNALVGEYREHVAMYLGLRAGSIKGNSFQEFLEVVEKLGGHEHAWCRDPAFQSVCNKLVEGNARFFVRSECWASLLHGSGCTDSCDCIYLVLQHHNFHFVLRAWPDIDTFL